MAAVRHMFPGKLISCFSDIPWPPRSPDLSCCDFFLWGILKSRVYSHKPRTLTDLKDTINQEVATLNRDIALLRRVMEDFKRRIENCIQESGNHLPDVIFHK
uniref:Uncharacterized protein n=1 Tax=Clastoptera arizonana TaxID=38151 RepID=A0A1B6E1X5_9HEMI